jgi:hypothetical protein
MALAHFSGGCCYCPGCPEPVLREVDGKIHFIVQIAHICAALRGGPRFDDTMTDNQRRDLPNLLLLCDPHHGEVDDEDNLGLYTAEVLRRWKRQREADPREALQRLMEVTPAGLRNIVADALEDHDVRLIQALDRLGRNDREAASLLRGLIDELTESYSRLRQSLDPDLVYSLGKSVRELRDIAPILDVFARTVSRNARTLRNLGDS